MRRVLTISAYILAAIAVWLTISVLWLWQNQESVVFQPPSARPPTPPAARLVQYSAPDGHGLFGYLVTPPSFAGTGDLVIAFHGNADLAVWLVPWAQELARRSGAEVFLPEFRGYAGISGRSTYATAAADALGALEFARTRKPHRLVLFGHSLGTAVATELAIAMQSDPPAALVLQSPFTSAREMAARMLVPTFRWFWKIISRVPFDTESAVRTTDVPVSVAHGSADMTIPVRMGRRTFQAARNRGTLLIVAGAGHNDVADVGGEEYWQWLTASVRGASPPVLEREQQRGRRLP
jgi:uncharacterized protein